MYSTAYTAQALSGSTETMLSMEHFLNKAIRNILGGNTKKIEGYTKHFHSPTQEMLSEINRQASDPSLDGHTLLTAALVCNQTALVESLLTAGADPLAPADKTTPLRAALHSPACLKHLLDHLVRNPDLCQQALAQHQDRHGNTILHIAAMSGHQHAASMVSMLLSAGANPQAENADGNIPQWCCKQSSVEEEILRFETLHAKGYNSSHPDAQLSAQASVAVEEEMSNVRRASPAHC